MKKGFTAILLGVTVGLALLGAVVWYFWMQKSINEMPLVDDTFYINQKTLEEPAPKLNDADDVKTEVNTLLQINLDNMNTDLNEDFSDLGQ